MKKKSETGPGATTDGQDVTTLHPIGQNILINAEAASFNITCYGFHLWAEDFLAAEKLYAPTARAGSFVAHFLCCQSVELSLKGFLSLKGIKRKELRKKFGHNLPRLFKEAMANGLAAFVTLNAGDLEVVTEANEWYDSVGGEKFQYFDVFEALHAFKRAPDLAGIEDVAIRLQSPELRDAVLKG
jgi:hypothetical protein